MSCWTPRVCAGTREPARVQAELEPSRAFCFCSGLPPGLLYLRPARRIPEPRPVRRRAQPGSTRPACRLPGHRPVDLKVVGRRLSTRFKELQYKSLAREEAVSVPPALSAVLGLYVVSVPPRRRGLDHAVSQQPDSH